MTVSAEKRVEDSEAQLEEEVVGVLRDAINTGNLENYFPPECQVQA